MTLLSGADGAHILPANYLTFGTVRTVRFPRPFEFRHPLTSHYENLPRRPNCPVCGSSPAEVRAVNVDEMYEQIMGPLRRRANE